MPPAVQLPDHPRCSLEQVAQAEGAVEGVQNGGVDWGTEELEAVWGFWQVVEQVVDMVVQVAMR